MGNLVWAIARASYASPRTNALLSVVCNHAADVVTEFTPEELTRLLHSLSVLSFYNRSLFEAAESIILERLHDFGPESLAMLATAFVSRCFYERFENFSCSDRLQALGHQQHNQLSLRMEPCCVDLRFCCC